MSASLASQTLVIVPTYNEADNIAPLVAALVQATPAVDILFVDDHSQDGTMDQITRMQHQYGHQVHLLARAGKLGLGTAYVAGFQWALTRGFHVVEAPIVFSERRVGASKMSTHIVLEAVLRTWQLRGLRPPSLLSQKATER
jgi:cellulose synthase/poly-beta-1,6-N-acetylglucosamine synthase-like glycosyltransferase